MGSAPFVEIEFVTLSDGDWRQRSLRRRVFRRTCALALDLTMCRKAFWSIGMGIAANATLLVSIPSANASQMAAGVPGCNSSYPSGSFAGAANSKQAGRLQSTLTLDCASGRYSGTLATSVGKFTVTSATFDGTTLHVHFSANGATGMLTAIVSNGDIKGTFALGSDSGTVTLSKAMAGEPPPVPTLRLNPPQWHLDLMYLAQQLPALHANAFHSISRTDFDHEVAQFGRFLPKMNGDEAYFGLDRIVNSVGDAHTYIKPPSDDANLPIDIERFGHDERVVAVAPTNTVALGARALAVDGVPIETVRNRLLTITPKLETMLLRQSRVDGFMTTGMLLHGAGIAKARNVVTFTLRSDDGKQFTDEVHAVSPQANVQYAWAWHSQALWHKRPGAGFWYAYLANSQTVYCRFRDYGGLARHTAALLRFVRQVHPSKLVIDMRGNGGGDYHDGLNDLISPIRTMSQINRKGHLFVLVDQDTFSAAMANAAQFRTYTRALLAGQVIGERPNSYQEPREFPLPNSGLEVRYSTKYYKIVDSGINEVVPDKVIAPTWAEFRAGDDPVLDWVLAYKHGNARRT